MKNMPPTITLLTDFGTADGYVGAIKGVILSRAPGATLIDITHDIAPQDVAAGARALREAAPWFPAQTIHLAVVDPGVGTSRAPLLLQGGGQLWIGPDNGLLSLAAPPSSQGWVLNRADLFQPRPSHTFHGRDIFASVAGHLAAGLAPERCGEPVERWVQLDQPRPRCEPGEVRGQVVHVDRFGNLITNLDRDVVGQPWRWQVHLGQRQLGPIHQTFADVESGRWVAYIGSSGVLEIAVRDGDAADALQRADARQTEVMLRICSGS